MKNIKYYSAPDIKAPLMVACWPGMGNVGMGAFDYLRLKLKARLFAEIDISDYAKPDTVVVRKGITSLPKIPNLSLYYTDNPPLIISLGSEQYYGQAGAVVMDRLLCVAEKFNVKRIITGAAFPTNAAHQDESVVYAAANTKDALGWLNKDNGLPIMPEGQISGLNGLLLEAARRKGIAAACLLATLPLYAIGLPNPKASKAIIETLQNMTGIEIDMTDLDLSIQEINKMLENVEEQLTKLGIDEHRKEYPPFKAGKEELPKKVLDNIEKLFEEAKRDKRVVHKLKEELDRWDLFKAYEDRFLDLFRESH
ncbi:MAG: PAC2 family protein [Candidatus Omnitrophica bacterium]|nr:PAC2 family protein [Candidatus Omnitrophota bacterium]